MGCEYVLFNVDDAFYVNPIDLQPAMAFLQETTATTQKSSDIVDMQKILKDKYNFSFHLKMTASTWMSHMTRQTMLPLPPFTLGGTSCPIQSVHEFLDHEKDSYLTFDPSKGCVDWNYPWDLSGSLYSSQTVEWVIAEIIQQHGLEGINHPNRLEFNGDQIVKKWQKKKQYSLRCACPNEPKMYVFAINQVQEVFHNPLHKVTASTLNTSTNGDLESLKRLYLDQKHLDLNFYRSKRFASVHIGHLELETDSKKNEPLVSVVIPVYNVEKYIVEALESIIKQSYRNLEILVIDDASTDNTRSIVALLIKTDPRIQLFINDSNRGIAYTLNRGFQLSKGDFIARMDGDDVSSCERIKKQIHFLQTHPEIHILGTSILIAKEKQEEFESSTRVIIYPTSPTITKWQMFFGCCVAHPTVMLRRQVLTVLQQSEGNTYYSLDATCSEDYELWLRCLVKYGFQIASLGEVLLYHRKHTTNTSKIHRERQMIETKELTKRYWQLFLNEEGESIPMDTFAILVNNVTVKPKTCEDLEKAIYLIEKLCKKVSHEKEMLDAEEKYIQQEAVARQGEIALRGMLTFPTKGGRLWANWSEKHPIQSRLAFQRLSQ
jgi:GT2 family glycosyltransferase